MFWEFASSVHSGDFPGFTLDQRVREILGQLMLVWGQARVADAWPRWGAFLVWGQARVAQACPVGLTRPEHLLGV